MQYSIHDCVKQVLYRSRIRHDDSAGLLSSTGRQAALTHPPDTRSECSLHRASSGSFPRTAGLSWGWWYLSPGGAASPGSPSLSAQVSRGWDILSPCTTVLNQAGSGAGVPVQCFFTSLTGIGWMATRYFGSASESKWGFRFERSLKCTCSLLILGINQSKEIKGEPSLDYPS